MGVDKPTTLEIPLISPGEEGELGAFAPRHATHPSKIWGASQHPNNTLDGPVFVAEMGDVDYETSDSDFAEGHDIDDALEVAGSGPFQLNLSFCVCLV